MVRAFLCCYQRLRSESDSIVNTATLQQLRVRAHQARRQVINMAAMGGCFASLILGPRTRGIDTPQVQQYQLHF